MFYGEKHRLNTYAERKPAAKINSISTSLLLMTSIKIGKQIKA